MIKRTADPINPWYFPSLGEYTSRLEQHGFIVNFAILFDRETELSEDGISFWARMFGRQFFEGVPEDKMEQILNRVNEKLKPTHFKGGKWFSYYKRLRVIAYRPG